MICLREEETIGNLHDSLHQNSNCDVSKGRFAIIAILYNDKFHIYYYSG